ncbi:MAG: sigma-54-dependent Fis family transcriptional regulator [Gammaproteobacteria bacterium]|nr:sigma-54-dependent Fis family transcriptional regulator [Gammaproteobacteria bacterium]
MDKTRLILIVEDDNDLREAICDTIRLSNFSVMEASNAEEALEILAIEQIDLIVSDVQMPGIDGHEFLSVSKRLYPDIPFVLATAYGEIQKAVSAIRAGAADYIVKPFEAEVLIEMINRLCPDSPEAGSLIVSDPKSLAVAKLAARVAETNVTVMISGESGCGKEVYSRFIHENSPRKKKPFCAINCAAIPEPMLESILFGYEKGAFTGAYTARAGKFEQANHGTLLLDEISEIDIGLQAKLLRVIQEREVERLGGNSTIKLDVRLIATTNRDLKEEVLAGRFREDLYYRLNVFPLHLPPLRERSGDIIPLAKMAIERLVPGQGINISPAAEEVLKNHYWRGNVRELENVIHRALILKCGTILDPQDLVFEDIPDRIEFGNESRAEKNTRTQQDAELGEDLKTREREIIIDAISRHSSRKEAAEKLGISPRTLRYKLAQFREEGLAVPAMNNALRA